MVKTIVIYKSKTGYTKQYATWLSEEFGCDMISLKNIGKVKLDSYDAIIYGAGVYASKISGLKKMIKACTNLKDKKIAFFAVGATGYSEDVLQKLKESNLSGLNLDYPLFYMQGGFDPQKLNVFLRVMLGIVARMLTKKEAKNPDALSTEDKDFLEFFRTTHNSVDKAYLNDLTTYVQG